MISRQLSARLRPVAFATLAAVVGAGTATIGLSPAETAAASDRSDSSVTRVIAEPTTTSALTRLLTSEGQR